MTAWRRKRGSKADIHKAAAEYHKQFAQQVIEQIKKGVAPWQKPWKPGEKVVPVNFNTGDPYRGGNAVYLASVSAQKGYSDHRWGTYRQVAAAGGYVRQGEKGVRLVYFTKRELKLVRDDDGRPKRDEDGRKIYEMVHLDKPKMNSFVVFNVEQADRLKLPPQRQEQPAWKAHKEAERVMKASGVPIQHVSGNRAFYRPGDDTVVLPEREQFPDADGYYQTALHELGHATGHENRMNRKVFRDAVRGGFGSPEYAREELRAEMSAMMIGTEVGVGHDPTRGAAYVESWVKALEKDPREIHKAAAEAWRMSAYLVNRAREFEGRETERVAGRSPNRREDQVRAADTGPAGSGRREEGHPERGEAASLSRAPAPRIRYDGEERAYYESGSPNARHTAIIERDLNRSKPFRAGLGGADGKPTHWYECDRFVAAERIAREYVDGGHLPTHTRPVQVGEIRIHSTSGPRRFGLPNPHARAHYEDVKPRTGRTAVVERQERGRSTAYSVKLYDEHGNRKWKSSADRIALAYVSDGRLPNDPKPSQGAASLPPLPAGMHMTSNGRERIRYEGGRDSNGRSAEIRPTQGKSGSAYQVRLQGQGPPSTTTITSSQEAHQAARDYVATGRTQVEGPEMNRQRQIERDAGPSR